MRLLRMILVAILATFLTVGMTSCIWVHREDEDHEHGHHHAGYEHKEIHGTGNHGEGHVTIEEKEYHRD